MTGPFVKVAADNHVFWLNAAQITAIGPLRERRGSYVRCGEDEYHADKSPEEIVEQIREKDPMGTIIEVLYEVSHGVNLSAAR